MKKITIRTFPTPEGDSAVIVAENAITEKDVFAEGLTVAMGNKIYIDTDWDKLLEDIHKSKENELEITRFRAIQGG